MMITPHELINADTRSIRIKISDCQRSSLHMRKLIWKSLLSGIREMLRVHRSQVEKWINLNFRKRQKEKQCCTDIKMCSEQSQQISPY